MLIKGGLTKALTTTPDGYGTYIVNTCSQISIQFNSKYLPVPEPFQYFVHSLHQPTYSIFQNQGTHFVWVPPGLVLSGLVLICLGFFLIFHMT